MAPWRVASARRPRVPRRLSTPPFRSRTARRFNYPGRRFVAISPSGTHSPTRRDRTVATRARENRKHGSFPASPATRGPFFRRTVSRSVTTRPGRLARVADRWRADAPRHGGESVGRELGRGRHHPLQPGRRRHLAVRTREETARASSPRARTKRCWGRSSAGRRMGAFTVLPRGRRPVGSGPDRRAVAVAAVSA